MLGAEADFLATEVIAVEILEGRNPQQVLVKVNKGGEALVNRSQLREIIWAMKAVINSLRSAMLLITPKEYDFDFSASCPADTKRGVDFVTELVLGDGLTGRKAKILD